MIDILWDASHLWGYLLLHAVTAAGVSFRVLKGLDIAQNGLSGKMLLVPGGSARLKARALGQAGMEAVRRFVREGGHYLGFCGGAGLALDGGLGLCGWKRADMSDRLQHLVSGRLLCDIAAEHPLIPSFMARKSALLPVWWPGRFDEPEKHDGVEVLARYRAAGPDLYVADMPFSNLPPDILAEWKTLYGVTLRPSLMDGYPCVITGESGRGSWFLSYSHLETPGLGNENLSSPGRWFLHVLREWGCTVEQEDIPALHPQALPVLWEEPVLLQAREELGALIHLAAELGLLFPRSSWLWGWRSGVPGISFNSLNLALSMTLGFRPDARRLGLWKERRAGFQSAFRLFSQGARSWLLARRLSDTLADSASGMLPRKLLVDQRRTLFGSPMSGGGIDETLLNTLETLV